MARRPRWIGALLLALAVASGFAALGQWQLARSIESARPQTSATEVVAPLDSLAEAQQPMTSAAEGQRVELSARFVPEDYVALSGRVNLAAPGYWVVGHAMTPDGSSVAVALGWCDTADAAAAAIDTLRSAPPDGDLVGRYLPSESPQQSDFEAGQRSALATAELVNLWSAVPGGVYSGYVVAASAPDGLTPIDSPPPIREVSLNLLNIFYAVEWVIFAGFAVFLWFRLMKDAWELEQPVDAGEPTVE